MDMEVAWRVFRLARLVREIPDVPCAAFFEDSQWKALVSFLKRTTISPAEARDTSE